MIFYRVLFKITLPNGRQWIEIFASTNLKHVREYAKHYAECIFKKIDFSLAGRYSISLPFGRIGYFYKDDIVQVVIEKVEKITHETNKCADLDEEYASITSSKDIIETNVIFEYAPGLWSTESIL